jgi:hypothetical protein
MEQIMFDLNEEEAKLLSELNSMQIEMQQCNPELINKQMLGELYKTSINSIAVALNISDFIEPDSRQYATNLQDLRDRKAMTSGDWRNSKRFKTKYKKAVKNICEKAGKIDGKRESFIDYHTGEKLVAVEDDYQFDHVKSVGECKDNALLGAFLSSEEIEDILNSEENLAATDGYLNNVKDKKSWKEWESWWNEPCKKDKTKTNAEYYNIDKKRARERFEQSQEALNKVVKQKIKSQAKQLGKQVGGFVLKMTVFKFVKIIVNEIIKECEKKTTDKLADRMKNVGERILQRRSELWVAFKDSAFASLISTLMDIIVNFFISTTKRAFKIIRQIFSSLISAFKVLFDKNKNTTEKINAALKIVGAALVGVLGIMLDEIISDALKTIPFFAPLADYISPVLSALIVGLGSTLIMQIFIKYQSKIKYQRLLEKTNEISRKLDAIAIVKSQDSTISLSSAFNNVISIYANTCMIASSCEKEILFSLSSIQAGSDERRALLDNIDKTSNEIDSLLLSCKKQLL